MPQLESLPVLTPGKKAFLEAMLKTAEENPQVVKDRGNIGSMIFLHPSNKEYYCICLRIDEKGKAYFIFDFNGKKVYDINKILTKAREYLPREDDEFIRQFHLYTEERVDLLDKVRTMLGK